MSRLVGYAVVEQGNARILVRRETHPESLSLENSVTNLMCTGVQRIVISATESTSSSGAEPTAIYQADGPLPDTLTVALYQSGEAAPALSHTFVIR